MYIEKQNCRVKVVGLDQKYSRLDCYNKCTIRCAHS